ncbi:Eukaryotic initiation factor 4F subunit p150 [Quillaja saponaria]|uniref:Eukaryotic initiation factor 4F subunit p150 n=1 Tax=Quillaja saponaria TaxID=32244 RepID=A0AAD7PKG5_QUISA|nr:Eukaryotic initiation factor 4F subunit p150 [Quillaja saponaria]
MGCCTAKLGDNMEIVAECSIYYPVHLTVAINNRETAASESRTRRTKGCTLCSVVPPPFNRVKPHAIINFLGGAFIGAVPESYLQLLIKQSAKEGFLVIYVPYSVTFGHAESAKQLYERFHACLNTILTFGLPHANLIPDQLVDLLFFIGHSNGARRQLLTNSYFFDKMHELGPVIGQMMPV